MSDHLSSAKDAVANVAAGRGGNGDVSGGGEGPRGGELAGGAISLVSVPRSVSDGDGDDIMEAVRNLAATAA